MATAKDTKMQENGSRVFFEQLIEKNKEASVNFIEDKAYPNMPAIWYQYYQLQGKALKKYLGNQRGYLYSRDEGIMPFLEKAAKDMGVSTKDKWNPMDIVMVKKSNESKIMKSVEKILAEKIEKEAKLEKLKTKWPEPDKFAKKYEELRCKEVKSLIFDKFLKELK